MRVLLYTSVSHGTPWATVTMPSRYEYCHRHGYTMIADHQPYEAGVACHARLLDMLTTYDVVWTLDADCLITDMRQRIEDVPGLGPHATACEERITADNRINCGSVVWRDTEETVQLLMDLERCEPAWRQSRYGWQSWLGDRADEYAGTLTILPPRAINSVEWSWGGGGCHWRPGDFVYHPCGLEHSRRADRLRELLPEVIR